jgi:uncharacterized protein (TIGR02598 family)
MKLFQTFPGHRRKKGAFSLVEVTIALGIVAFAVVVLFALLPTGVSTVQQGQLEEGATEILTAVATDLRSTPSGTTNTPIFRLPVRVPSPSAQTLYFGGAGERVLDVEGARFRLTATPQTNQNPRLSTWHLSVSWPASPQAATGGQAETVVFLSRP